jgi:protein-tyrosine-phosphatase
MAEAITRAHAAARGMDVDVSSAGTHAETTITPHAVDVLRARGINAEGRQAVQLTAELLEEADLVLAMTLEHVAAARKLGFDAHLWTAYVGALGDIPDPMGRPLDVYESTAARMESLADALLDTLI